MQEIDAIFGHQYMPPYFNTNPPDNYIDEVVDGESRINEEMSFLLLIHTKMDFVLM